MKKIFILAITLCSASILLFSFSSCSGCVKKISKKVTETGLDVVEGMSEAVDEHGERVSEKAADAAGKVAVGVGRSLDRFLDEHASNIASVGGRTVVQSVDGFTDGFNEEVKKHYDAIPHTDNFCSGVALDYFAKYKTTPIVDAYFIIMESGVYKCKFECVGPDGKIFLTKEAEINKIAGERKYSLVSFALNPEEEKLFETVANVKITVSKKK